MDVVEKYYETFKYFSDNPAILVRPDMFIMLCLYFTQDGIESAQSLTEY